MVKEDLSYLNGMFNNASVGEPKKYLPVLTPTVNLNTERNNVIRTPIRYNSLLSNRNMSSIPRERALGNVQRQNNISIVNPNNSNVGAEFTILDANGNTVRSGVTEIVYERVRPTITNQKASQLKNVNVGGDDFNFLDYYKKQTELLKTQSKNSSKIVETLGGDNKGFKKLLSGIKSSKTFNTGLGFLAAGLLLGAGSIFKYMKSDGSDVSTRALLYGGSAALLSTAIGGYLVKRQIGKWIGLKGAKVGENVDEGLAKGGEKPDGSLAKGEIEEGTKGGKAKATSKGSKIGGKLKSVGSKAGKLGILASGAMLVSEAGSTIGGLFDDKSKGEVKGAELGGTIGAVTGGLAATVGLSKLASSGKGVLAKGAGKVAMKGLGKIIPGAGFVVGAAEAYNYFNQEGPLAKAQGILASAGAIASLIPGLGTGISLATSAINLGVDLLKDSNGSLENNTKAVKENTEKQDEKTVTNEEVSSTNMPKRVDESSDTVVSGNTQEESKNNVMSESQKMYQIKADDISMRNLHNIENKIKTELSLEKITNDKYIELMNNVSDLRHAALTVGENGVEADTLEVMSEVLKELKGINVNTKQEKVPVRVFDRN